MNTFRKIALPLALVAALAGPAFTQLPSEKSKKSEEIVNKVRQLDLMNHILPILFTKDQLNQILPAIEKGRQNVKLTEDAEYSQLMSMDPQISEALDKALNQGLVPGKELIRGFSAKFNGMDAARKYISQQNTDLVYAVVKTSTNDGQRKAMANEIVPDLIDHSLKSEKMTDEEKIKFYIGDILLDPLAYDLLVKLSRSPNTADK